MDISKINTIVLSGGGTKGISYVGFFNSLFKHINKEQIKHYIGVSAGAMFALCIVLNYTIDDIKKILFKYDFNKVIPDLNNIDNLFLNYGLSDGSEMKKLITDIIEYKIGIDNINITFKELYEKTKIQLTMVVTNFTLQVVEYWNHVNTPDFSVLDGILATTRVPLFFTPLNINNNHYLDGGIINNYPIDFIPIENVECVIGVCLTSRKDIENVKNLFDKDNKYDKIITYIIDVLMLTYDSKLITINQKYIERTLQFQTSFSNFLDVNLSECVKNKMIEDAVSNTEIFLQKFSKPIINSIIDNIIDNIEGTIVDIIDSDNKKDQNDVLITKKNSICNPIIENNFAN